MDVETIQNPMMPSENLMDINKKLGYRKIEIPSHDEIATLTLKLDASRRQVQSQQDQLQKMDTELLKMTDLLYEERKRNEKFVQDDEKVQELSEKYQKSLQVIGEQEIELRGLKKLLKDQAPLQAENIRLKDNLLNLHESLDSVEQYLRTAKVQARQKDKRIAQLEKELELSRKLVDLVAARKEEEEEKKLVEEKIQMSGCPEESDEEDSEFSSMASDLSEMAKPK